jgi:ABC-2 type transport system ATP-binding protein
MMTADARPLLVLTGVSRSYGALAALKKIDIAVTAGRCLALLGVNGSGKSTLLRIAAGRDTPTTGQVRYGGLPLREDDLVARTEVAVVGDVSSAYPDLTVREHLQLVAIAHGAGARTPGLVDDALRECRLSDHDEALPGSLSSGQRQALQLAAVLVRPRRLLILDEPEQRLDPGARRWLADLLVREKSRGAAVLLATHHVELAEAVADEAVVLLDGEVIGRGAPDAALGSLR